MVRVGHPSPPVTRRIVAIWSQFRAVVARPVVWGRPGQRPMDRLRSLEHQIRNLVLLAEAGSCWRRRADLGGPQTLRSSQYATFWPVVNAAVLLPASATGDLRHDRGDPPAPVSGQSPHGSGQAVRPPIQSPVALPLHPLLRCSQSTKRSPKRLLELERPLHARWDLRRSQLDAGCATTSPAECGSWVHDGRGRPTTPMPDVSMWSVGSTSVDPEPVMSRETAFTVSGRVYTFVRTPRSWPASMARTWSAGCC
jgi:hypothetical protein